MNYRFKNFYETMGHGNKIVIPDWKEYKIDGIKELESLQTALKSRGLKDPWIR